MPKALVCLEDEDLATARRKSRHRWHRFCKGRFCGRTQELVYYWWQGQGRYEYEIEARPKGRGGYTGRVRCATN